MRAFPLHMPLKIDKCELEKHFVITLISDFETLLINKTEPILILLKKSDQDQDNSLLLFP